MIDETFTNPITPSAAVLFFEELARVCDVFEQRSARLFLLFETLFGEPPHIQGGLAATPSGTRDLDASELEAFFCMTDRQAIRDAGTVTPSLELDATPRQESPSDRAAQVQLLAELFCKRGGHMLLFVELAIDVQPHPRRGLHLSPWALKTLTDQQLDELFAVADERGLC